MKNFWKVLGKILVGVIYVFVVVVIIGILRWIFLKLFCKSD